MNLIVAVDKNWAIGHENDLLFSLPGDMKHFRTLTTGGTVIMGRKTFESLPKGALPNRRNIVLSRQDIEFPGAGSPMPPDEIIDFVLDRPFLFVITNANIPLFAGVVNDP